LVVVNDSRHEEMRDVIREGWYGKGRKEGESIDGERRGRGI
jgi:hypothetical protein